MNQSILVIILVFSIGRLVAQDVPEKDTTAGKIKLKGKASLEHWGHQIPGTLTHAYYIRINPQFIYKGLPLDLQFSYTNDTFIASPLKYGVSFDIQKAKGVLQHQILEYVLAKHNLSPESFYKKNQKIKAYEAFLNDSTVQTYIDSANTIQQIENQRSELENEKNKLLELQKTGYDSTQIGSEIQAIQLKLDSVQNRVASFSDRKGFLYKYKKIEEDYSHLAAEMDGAREYASIEQWDYNTLFTKAGSLGIIPKWANHLYRIKNLSLGLASPDYSPFTIQNAELKGADVEFAVSKMSVSITAGDIILPFVFEEFPSANSRIAAARIALGNKNNEIYLNGLYGRNRNNEAIEALENSVVGIGLNINSPDGNLSIEGEVALSMLSGFNNENQFSKTSSSLKQIGSVFFGKKAEHSLVDLGAFIRSELLLFNQNTNLTGALNYTGTNYLSFGNHYLRNDINRWDVGIKQNIIKDFAKVHASFSKGRDNLLSYKYLTTEVTRISAGITISPKRFPTIQLNYLPFNQYNESSSTRSSAISLLIAGNYSLGSKITAQTTIMGLKNIYSSEFSDTAIALNYNIISLNQSLSISKFSISASMSLMQTPNFEEIIYGSLSVTSAINKYVQLSIGGKYDWEMKEDVKVGYFIGFHATYKRLGLYSNIENDPFFDPENLTLYRGFMMRSGISYNL